MPLTSFHFRWLLGEILIPEPISPAWHVGLFFGPEVGGSSLVEASLSQPIHYRLGPP
jgi:hypothetical protein